MVVILITTFKALVMEHQVTCRLVVVSKQASIVAGKEVVKGLAVLTVFLVGNLVITIIENLLKKN